MSDLTIGRIVTLSDARESAMQTHADVEKAIKQDRATCSTGYCQCAAKDARIKELEAEAAGLREDRERLDWMEAQMLKANCWLPGYNRNTKTWFVADEAENEPTFRAALDAARSEGKESAAA